MRNASNGQCKTGAVEWQVAVTNRENKIHENVIIVLLLVAHLRLLHQSVLRVIPKLSAVLFCHMSLDVTFGTRTDILTFLQVHEEYLGLKI